MPSMNVNIATNRSTFALPGMICVGIVAILFWCDTTADSELIGNAQETTNVFLSDTNDLVHLASSPSRSQPVKTWQASFRRTQEFPPMKDHVWRNTPEGWTQIRIEPLPFTHKLELPYRPPSLHPFSVASLILLMCLAAMAWASSEWDWQRFIADD